MANAATAPQLGPSGESCSHIPTPAPSDPPGLTTTSLSQHESNQGFQKIVTSRVCLLYLGDVCEVCVVLREGLGCAARGVGASASKRTHRRCSTTNATPAAVAHKV